MRTDVPLLQGKRLLVKRGGITVLDIPEFEIKKGGVLSLIGPNGSGKSTLLLTLSCLLKLSKGELIFNGQKIDNRRSELDYRRQIAVVFQDPLLFDATVLENVASGLKIRGLDKRERSRIAEEYLERLGIAHLARRSASKLSGGEAQRTSIARAFAVRPAILFLDEPFSALDPPTHEALISDLNRLLQDTDTTAVMATHDQMDALRLSDRIAVLQKGTIAQAGSAEVVMNHPINEFVASFVGMDTVLSGTVRDILERDRMIIAVGNREIEAVGNLSQGEKVLCFIRPENVTLSTDSPEDPSSARNNFSGRIIRIAPHGLFYRIDLNCGFDLISYITRTSLDLMELREGQRVKVSFKATAVHVIRKSA
ncbi:tungstate transport system ATP-binding protein [Syntrophus gentianae]|uniref:Tungstate transport system ATP-binding protein n=1 Tax=Syntrophus gentianae TaxID=43775 RepID=A0A1H8AUL6_9BACT|nr:ABC transporter ATP-binding protein [Syntrophus gentianae]SEM74410.1 tungstate transport system ATP-binding protein [Syntrophus gentianae]